MGSDECSEQSLVRAHCTGRSVLRAVRLESRVRVAAGPHQSRVAGMAQETRSPEERDGKENSIDGGSALQTPRRSINIARLHRLCTELRRPASRTRTHHTPLN